MLVLDEPTAALVSAEVSSLFDVLRSLRDKGIAIIFISHYMQEIMDICDDVTVLRNGDEIFASMRDAIRSAKRSIDLVTFVFWKDQITQDFTDALIERANASGTALFTRTVLDGRSVLRISIGSHTTRQEHVDAAWSLLTK